MAVHYLKSPDSMNSQKSPVAQEMGPPSEKVHQWTGFDCVFVDPPPEHLLQTECPVCLLVIREPHQVTCCGYSFCHSCVEQVKAASKSCPICNDEKFTDFPNKGLQRTLYSLKVHCTHRKDGCEWTGELGQLDDHLRANNGCSYLVIQCVHCGELTQRQRIEAHLTEHCPKRPFSCEHCKAYESTYDNVVHNHWPVCGSFPVQCPNDCGSTLQRQNLDHHVTEECPLTTISCDFVGCPVKLPRKDMSEHLRENLLTHISLLAASHTKQQALIAQLVVTNSEQQAQINSLIAENQELKKLLTKPKTEVVRNKEITVLSSKVIVMHNFQQHKKEDDIWFSPPVYTHSQGYKLCLAVYANGDGPGKGSHTSVYVHLMKGEFDDALVWPFRGVIKYQLLDQSGGEDHRVGNSTYHEHRSEKSCGRVMYALRAQGVGMGKFVSHDSLKKYLSNDCLSFRICGGEVCL